MNEHYEEALRQHEEADEWFAKYNAERARSQVLEVALRFYADPDGYTDTGIKTDGAGFGWDHPDRGAAARAALEDIL